MKTVEGFDCNLPNLLREAVSNDKCSILRIPAQIALGLLSELASLALEIDDKRLHIMMLRLGLYECTAHERVEKIKELKRSMSENMQTRLSRD